MLGGLHGLGLLKPVLVFDVFVGIAVMGMGVGLRINVMGTFGDTGRLLVYHGVSVSVH